jgi:16S rRNA (cytidine1402-2'-O)-methyltransferase
MLYLIPTFLSEQADVSTLAPQVIEVVSGLRHFVVENEKTARRHLKRMFPAVPQSELQFWLLNEHERPLSFDACFAPLGHGQSIGLLSEAGCPGIADPGADLVAYAHKKGIKVMPLVGPSSITLAVMASGFNGQSFSFVGYLPIDQQERKNRILFLEKESARTGMSFFFIETPYRNTALLESLTKSLKGSTRIFVGVDLSLKEQEIWSKPASSWKQLPEIHKRPAIFGIMASS